MLCTGQCVRHETFRTSLGRSHSLHTEKWGHGVDRGEEVAAIVDGVDGTPRPAVAATLNARCASCQLVRLLPLQQLRHEIVMTHDQPTMAAVAPLIACPDQPHCPKCSDSQDTNEHQKQARPPMQLWRPINAAALAGGCSGSGELSAAAALAHALAPAAVPVLAAALAGRRRQLARELWWSAAVAAAGADGGGGAGAAGCSRSHRQQLRRRRQGHQRCWLRRRWCSHFWHWRWRLRRHLCWWWRQHLRWCFITGCDADSQHASAQSEMGAGMTIPTHHISQASADVHR